ncbi:MAG TPA: cysteine desulfurase-like protein [Micromonosporaceae bacterium]
MSYDVEEVRRQFPALSRGVAHFEGAGGTLVPEVVAEAVATALNSGLANRGRLTDAARRADDIVHAARRAMADLLGCQPRGVVFGRSMTQLTYDMARTLAKTWSPGDEVVVTRLEHDANLRPWLTVAESAGATARWVDFDPDTTELAATAVAAALSERTRLVAVTGASNLLGTRPDLPAIAAAVHAAGPALLYVDGVHLTPHAAIDMTALGVDFFTCSPYKFCGPHLGVLAAAPDLLETLRPDRLLPSTDEVPERFELGTLPYELLAGVTATVDFLAGLAARGSGSRHARLLGSMAAIERYEQGLLSRLEAGLNQIEPVVQHGRATRRTPTVLFSVRGVASPNVSQALADADVSAPSGHFYAIEPARHIGLPEGAVRASLAPYCTAEDVDRLLTVVARLANVVPLR